MTLFPSMSNFLLPFALGVSCGIIYALSCASTPSSIVKKRVSYFTIVFVLLSRQFHDMPTAPTDNNVHNSGLAPRANSTSNVNARRNLDTQPIVYIAGRYTGNERGKGDISIVDQLHLSVRSACYTTKLYATNNNSTKLPSLSFLIYISEADYKDCKPMTNRCDYSMIEKSCQAELPGSTVEYLPLDDNILSLWKEHTGIVSFEHHSTWYGYAKIWLPILLGDTYSTALFVDTDTIWNHPPSKIFEELRYFNSTQVIGATSLMGSHLQSKSFTNRITSGVLLIDLAKIRQTVDWIRIVKQSVVSNRGGLEPNERIPDNYNRSAHCEIKHPWGAYSKPLCLLKANNSTIRSCNITRTCWHAEDGDQEFFSNIFSFFHPELLYVLDGKQPKGIPHKHQCIKMGSFKEVLHNCKDATLIHAPQVSDLWNEKEGSFLPDLVLNGILPSAVYSSVNWFRVHIKNVIDPLAGEAGNITSTNAIPVLKNIHITKNE